MSSINQSLPMETLLQVLKSLGSKDMVKSRRTCREWNQMLDEHQSCWKEVAVIPEMSLLHTQSAVALFDSKSGSQLTKVSLIIRLEESEELRVASFPNTLLKSIRTLKTISIQLIQYHASHYYDDPLTRLAGVLIAHAPNLIEYKQFRPLEWESCRLMFPMPPAVPGATKLAQQNSRLKVLCLPFFHVSRLLSIHFPSLASFSIAANGFGLSEFLQKHSKTLKHIRLPPLEKHFTETFFPLLEVLELDSPRGRSPTFPNWILAPANLKVRAQQIPLSSKSVEYSSLWTSSLGNIDLIDHNAPRLLILRTQFSGGLSNSTEFESLVKALELKRAFFDLNRCYEDYNRFRTVEQGPLPLHETESGPLKKLIIPFNQLTPQQKRS